MRLEKADIGAVVKHYKSTKIQQVVDEFIKMDTPCVKVAYDTGEYKNVYSASTSIRNYLKHNRISGVRCMVIQRECYIINTFLSEKA